jgi:hypothetical protein
LQCDFILSVGLPAYFGRFRIAAAIEGQTPAYYAYELRIARLHRIAASHKLTQELRITIVPYGGYHSAYASLYAGRTHAIALSYGRVHLGSYVIQKILVLHRHYYGAYQVLIAGIFRRGADFHQFTFNEIRYLHRFSSLVLLYYVLFYILPKYLYLRKLLPKCYLFTTFFDNRRDRTLYMRKTGAKAAPVLKGISHGE